VHDTPEEPVTNPATELRAAVAHLRARLNDPELTPGPWLSMDHGDRLLWDGEGADDLPPRYVVDEPMSNGANADYIELMHPGVGAILVRWLTDAASDIDANGGTVQSSSEDDALAVARLINERA
jgi:hypothetical protein